MKGDGQRSLRGRWAAGFSALTGLLVVGLAGVAAANSQEWKANITGGGRPNDLVYIQQAPGTPATTAPTWLLKVRLPNGNVLSLALNQDDNPPTLARVGNVDGRPGDELFVGSHVGPESIATVVTYRRGALVAEKPDFLFGTPDPAEYAGLTCSSHKHAYFITAHEFRNTMDPGALWTRQDTSYIWSHGHLKRYARHRPHSVKGNPPRSQTGIACGHTPTPAG